MPSHLIYDCLFPVLCWYFYIYLYAGNAHIFSQEKKKTANIQMHLFESKTTQHSTTEKIRENNNNNNNEELMCAFEHIVENIVCVFQCLSVVVSLTDNVPFVGSFFLSVVVVVVVVVVFSKPFVCDVNFSKPTKKTVPIHKEWQTCQIVTKNGNNNGMLNSVAHISGPGRSYVSLTIYYSDVLARIHDVCDFITFRCPFTV